MAVFFYLALISHQASACDDHFYLNSDDFGVVKGAVLRLAGLVAPEPVFKLKHSPVEKAMLGEASEITIDYKRPWFSSNVYLQLKSTRGIQLIDHSIALDDYDGTVKIRYILEKPGFNSIALKVSGEYKGQRAISSRMIYIQPKKTSNETNKLQVGGR